jgi:hypothetical protein
MGGVDIANQLQAVYESHHKAQYSWWPLFYWYLDIALVNAYHINYILQVKHQLPRLTHAEFHEALYKDLFTQGHYEQEKVYKPKLQSLTGQHKPIQHENRLSCEWYLLHKKRLSLKS